MSTKVQKILTLIALSLIPTLLIWLPFLLRLPSFWHIPLPQNGLATIGANYDGPLYIAVAKSLYDPELIKANYQFPLTTQYYTAHFPLFPLLIKLFSFLTNSIYAMLAVTLLSSFLAIYFFYKLTNNLFLTAIFSILPARWLIVRSVGSADPLFVAGILASLYFFINKKYWWAGIWGAIAQMTKSPAILLFISYVIFVFWKDIKNYQKYLPLLLIPVSIFVVFLFYYFQTGDFFTYFRSGDNIHLFFPPFQIFNYSAPWVGTFWLEEIIFVYLIGTIGVVRLFIQKNYEMAVFAGVFMTSLLFVSHRDLVRYALPIVPLLLISFSEVLMKKEFKIALAVIIVPIYLFSLAFISQNVMPISNWGPFL